VSQREDRHRRPPGRQRVRVLEGVLNTSPAPPVGATGGRRFRLRASVEPLAVGSDLYLVRAGDDDLVIRNAGDADRALLELLARQSMTIAELEDSLSLGPGDVRDKLDALEAAGALAQPCSSPPLDPEDADRYSRQLPYLAEHGDAHELQRRLARARVVVLGCGGLGSWALASLAAAGVRHLRLVDHDAVEPSNLNRQAIFGRADVGVAKVEAAAGWLRAFDERIEVEPVAARADGVDTLRALVADADALVLTADEPPYELGRWANAACLEAGVPFITGGQLPPVIRAGPLYVPGRTACFACHETALRSRSIAYDRYVERARTHPSRAATLGPTSAIVGSLLALDLMHHLIGVEPATAGTAITFDIRTLRVRREPVPRDPACPACGSL
jgi:molybdopterin/thiamine biosynthesis adenylyltransferase